MEVTNDPHTDTLNVVFKENEKVAESDEEKPGVILDYGQEGDLLAIEILDASSRVTEIRNVDFSVMDSS